MSKCNRPDTAVEELFVLPGHLIRRSQQIAVALFNEEVGALEVTPVQYGILAAVVAHPGIDATRVSEMIAFDRSTLGDVLDRIEGKGWIERRASPTDRRVKHLWLTRRGTELFRAARPGVMRAQERILAPLDPADRDRFIVVLRQLVGLHTGEDRYG